jgi:hypothetical protein
MQCYSRLGLKNIEYGKQTDIFILDFEKAFGTMPHELILHLTGWNRIPHFLAHSPSLFMSV